MEKAGQRSPAFSISGLFKNGLQESSILVGCWL